MHQLGFRMLSLVISERDIVTRRSWFRQVLPSFLFTVGSACPHLDVFVWSFFVCFVLGSLKGRQTPLGCGHFTEEYIDALKGLLVMYVCFALFFVSFMWRKGC